MTKHKTINKPISKPVSKPSREEAMDAVRTMIAWAGDDPSREGLLETPKRVIKAYEEFFAGYDMDPDEILNNLETKNFSNKAPIHKNQKASSTDYKKIESARYRICESAIGLSNSFQREQSQHASSHPDCSSPP